MGSLSNLNLRVFTPAFSIHRLGKSLNANNSRLFGCSAGKRWIRKSMFFELQGMQKHCLIASMNLVAKETHGHFREGCACFPKYLACAGLRRTTILKHCPFHAPHGKMRKICQHMGPGTPPLQSQQTEDPKIKTQILRQSMGYIWRPSCDC